MKKLLVMLLALTMVLSMSFAFASCGGDADETSKPDSKVESSAAASDDATSEETSASTDAASSEDSDAAPSEDSSADATTEPSEDASADEPSTDVSVDGPSTDDPSSEIPAGPVEYKTTAAKTNYALKKTYTLTRDGTDTDPNYLYLGHSDGNLQWSDVNLTKMTDGVVGDITNENYSGSMVGMPDISVMHVGTNKLFEYIIDLGDYYGDINAITFRQVRNAKVGGGNRGFKLRLAYVSDNGVDFTKVTGTMVEEQVPGAPEIKSNLDETILNVEHFNYTYKLSEAAKGRYVRVILVSDGGYVIQLEEIEVWNK